MAKKAEFKRPRGIGGTDASNLIKGKWKDLWLEKTGETKRTDLSDNIAVQLGIFTEKFNRQWYQKSTKQRVVDVGKTWHHPEHSYIYGSLDGVTNGKVWEGKHTNMLSKDDTITERYYPQLQHYMLVTGFSSAILSVIYGNNKYNIFKIDRDEKYINNLYKACQLFWFMVENKIPPPEYVDITLMEDCHEQDDIVKIFGEEVPFNSRLQGTIH
tara:strand:+ start:181 stop:819 length:639 start_codon:yes stop_codon:yes gene_type:complete